LKSVGGGGACGKQKRMSNAIRLKRNGKIAGGEGRALKKNWRGVLGPRSRRVGEQGGENSFSRTEKTANQGVRKKKEKIR